ncbi:MAG: peptidoglycan DD-metalloendopeptidase family protein [Micrococcaceae bacterium]
MKNRKFIALSTTSVLLAAVSVPALADVTPTATASATPTASSTDSKGKQLQKQSQQNSQALDETTQEVNTYTQSYQDALAKAQTYQSQLAQAQAKLNAAKLTQSQAQKQADSLKARLDTASDSRTEINKDVQSEQAKVAQTQKNIAGIARITYENSDINQDLTTFFDPDQLQQIAQSEELSDATVQKLKEEQNQLQGQQSTLQNSQARLDSVVSDIASLKKQADAANKTAQEQQQLAEEASDEIDKLNSEAKENAESLEKKRKQAMKEQSALQQKQVTITQSLETYQKEQIKVAQQQAKEVAAKATSDSSESSSSNDSDSSSDSTKKQTGNTNISAPDEITDDVVNQLAETTGLDSVQVRALLANSGTTSEALDNKNLSTSSVDDISQLSPELRNTVLYLVKDKKMKEVTGTIDNKMEKPVDGKVFSNFGDAVNPVTKISYGTDGATGITYTAECDAPVKSTGKGVVLSAGDSDGYGNRVVVDFGVVDGKPLLTTYNHLQNFTVSVGQKVSAGQTIGNVGKTGSATSCNLLFEVNQNGKLVDPSSFLR